MLLLRKPGDLPDALHGQINSVIAMPALDVIRYQHEWFESILCPETVLGAVFMSDTLADTAVSRVGFILWPQAAR